MRKSLLVKLLGAFLAVILVGALVISIFVARSTSTAFLVYTTGSGQVLADKLTLLLADYYRLNDSWQNVDTFFLSDSGMMTSEMMAAQGQGGQARNPNQRRQGGYQGMMNNMGQYFILADDRGGIVYDSQGVRVGSLLSAKEQKASTSVLVDNNQVGSLVVITSGAYEPASLAGQFLSTVYRSIAWSVVVTVLIALGLGSLLFLQIIAPLKKLKKAAQSISAGDLSSRVVIRSNDELGDVGKAFNQMAESLDCNEKLRQQLIADIAHELRNPLSVIQANLEGMLDGIFPLDMDQVSAVHLETLLLNRLIEDLRLLSLADAGELQLEKSEMDLVPLIEQIVDRFRPQARQKNIALVLDLETNLPTVSLDPQRFSQILTNLLGNALRYTPEDGAITLKAILLPAESHRVEISVTDTGPGIDPQDLPFLFDRFYRADKSRSRSSGGSGLGLAIVKKLIEAHGGTVNAFGSVFTDSNDQGYGARIVFTIPF